jgi:large subunit ribosomal protein L20
MGDMRNLWNVRINSLLHEKGLSFSKFIGALKSKNIAINRKMLSEMALHNPNTFEKIVQKSK